MILVIYACVKCKTTDRVEYDGDPYDEFVVGKRYTRSATCKKCKSVRYDILHVEKGGASK